MFAAVFVVLQVVVVVHVARFAVLVTELLVVDHLVGPFAPPPDRVIDHLVALPLFVEHHIILFHRIVSAKLGFFGLSTLLGLWARRLIHFGLLEMLLYGFRVHFQI